MKLQKKDYKSNIHILGLPKLKYILKNIESLEHPVFPGGHPSKY